MDEERRKKKRLRREDVCTLTSACTTPSSEERQPLGPLNNVSFQRLSPEVSKTFFGSRMQRSLDPLDKSLIFSISRYNQAILIPCLKSFVYSMH